MDETQKQAMDVKPNCTKLRETLPYCFLVLTVFCLSFIFFNTLHPLVIFDTDDWCYLTYPREAVPIPGEWNPTRIFPEVLMPIAASFAGYVLTPAMGGDFIDAMIVTNALVAALFIAVYVLSFSLFIQRRCKLKAAWAVLLGGVFFLLHFLALRGLPSENMHLFWSVNVTSFYFYTLPSIFCAILVLYAMSTNVLDAFFKPEHLVKKSFLVLAFYLALFSNLFSSIIVGAYAGSVLVFRLCGAVKAGFDLKSFCTENAAYIILIVVWAFVQLLEVMGGRASTLLNDTSFGELILQTLNALSALAVKKLFIVLCIGAVLLYVFAVCKKPSVSKYEDGFQSVISPKQTVPMVLLVFFAAVLAFVYIVLICAKANPSYAGRADVVFFGLLFCHVCRNSLFSHCDGAVSFDRSCNSTTHISDSVQHQHEWEHLQRIKFGKHPSRSCPESFARFD